MSTRGVRRLFYAGGAVLLSLSLAAAARAGAPPHSLLAPAAAISEIPPATTTPNTYFVVKVVDGDTVDVAIEGTTTRLRLIGMDTPEVVDPRKPVQCFGREASAEGHALLDGQWVRLEYDPIAGVHDQYGRTLAYVFRASDGLFYNEYMIAQGFAHEYDYKSQRYTYRAQFKAAQTEAKAALRGFWSPSACDGNTTKPAGAQ